MLLGCIRQPDESLYHSQVEFTLHGALPAERLDCVWQAWTDHHPIFRTAFVWENLDSPLQVTLKQTREPVACSHSDWSHLTDDEFSTEWQRLKQDDRQAGFDLQTPPLSRLHARKQGDQHWRILWTYHHLLLDGWSSLALLKELCEAISMDTLDHWQPSPRPEFRDYVQWLGDQGTSTADAWQPILHDFSTVNDIRPKGFLSPDANTERGTKDATQAGRRALSMTSPAQLHQRLNTRAREQRCTVASIVHAAWALVLARIARSEDVLFGVTTAGRPSALTDSRSILGMCINTVPFRLNVCGESTIREHIHNAARMQRHVLEQEFASLSALQKHTAVPGGTPLFQSVVVSHDFGDTNITSSNAKARIDGLQFREFSDVPLALLWSNHEAFSLEVLFDTAYFNTSTATALGELFVNTVNALCELPIEAAIHSCEGNQSSSSARAGLITHEISDEEGFANLGQHLRSDNDQPALVYEDTTLSYAELLSRSVGVERQITLAVNASAQTRLGIACSNPLGFVIAMITCLRMGVCYIPLNPTWPRQRLQNMADIAGLHGVVVDQALEPLRNLTQIDIGDATASAQSESLPNETSQVWGSAGSEGQDDLAYILFTSGSTGQPKGVAITRANLAYSTRARAAYYSGPATFLLLSEFTFDSSVAGIFGTLYNGGSIVLTDADERRDLDAARPRSDRPHGEATPGKRYTHYAVLLRQLNQSRSRTTRVPKASGRRR